jgi:SpoVK/Ycf46/Vps4 family AAA+-type ATPase
MSELVLVESKHPLEEAQQRFDELIGIDDHKQQIVDHLLLHLDPERLRRWARKHHGKGLAIAHKLAERAPLILLSGDVGCGKTALATSAATPLAKQLNAQVLCFETPSDIRGSGRVGEISARITAAFHQARSRLSRSSYGLLVIDEADDLATSRSQMQAHHEDRAGLNVLVKQLDMVDRERSHLGVLLITNRAGVLDPAVVRRISLHLSFHRPDDIARRKLFEQMLAGTHYTSAELNALVDATASQTVPYSYSDLTGRLAQAAIYRAWREDRPFGVGLLQATVAEIEPSPLVDVEPLERR